MVNLKPGEYMKKLFFSQSHRQLGSKIRLLPTGVEPMTFWLLDVQMLYYSATRDCWELWPLSYVLVTNVLHAARTGC